MYLKEIEVSGFKSFADKLNFKLDNNITCIVGPNGSGKSNVVDAVRWVLGEQSVKSLRGDGAMSDVIFSGSKSRNASGVASVSLTFDNSDHYLPISYEEVSIKRRIYRTGENEYFLNGEKCRLKDITDLFLDSGIGKFSFNIISQGEVMRILSNSPYDRRIIFEEAARVLKYKKRKEEAIRKLDRTNQNLERVNDIIGELENQVGPLKEQSRKAREYLEVKNNLEQQEVALLATEITLLTSENENRRERLLELEKDSVTLNSTLNKTDLEVDEKRILVLKIENEEKQKNQQLLELTKEVEKLNGEKRILKERSKLNANDNKVHEQLLLLNEKKLDLENQIFKLEKEIETKNYEEANLDEKLKENQELQISWNRRRENYLREYNTKSREYLEIKSKIQILENNIESLGGVPSSVKAILNNPRLKGIESIFSNLISIDSKFVKALEVGYQASKNAIVVETDNDAKNAISYLKEQRLGRATFYPINTMKPRFVDNDTLNILKNEMGFIDVLSNLVSYNPKYDSVILSQLGNILVTIDVDSATKISKKIQSKYRIVTLDGEIINVGGSITGGTLNTTRSILSEKEELESLKLKKKNLKESILELDNSLKELEDERGKMEEIRTSLERQAIKEKEQIKSQMDNLLALKEAYSDTKTELSSFSAVVSSSLEEEEKKLIEDYSRKVDEKNLVEQQLRKLSIEKDKLQQEIDEMDAKVKEANFKNRKLEQEAKALEISINQNDMKLDRYLSILNEEYSMTYEKAKEEYHLEIELEEARDKVNHYKSLLKKIGMVNLDSIEEYDRVNERYTFLTKQKEDLDHAKESLFEIISEMDEVVKCEFVKTFELVRSEFKNVFTSLFGGGTADLKLTDPDNILETGIEIVASPPGKKLTTITLLSGGEKTLTAISLLFAILNVQTVPFCLFDEVEAALDEANVDRFGKYLDHYKDKTQFLLITHKKKTMEYAKTLYGITMQESGVSKLVSVKFDAFEEVK